MWNMFGTGGKIGLIGGLVGGAAGVIAALVAVLSGPGGFSGKIGGLIFVSVFVMVFVGVFYFVYKKVFAPVARQQKLEKTGAPAEATILSVEETGMTVNEIYPVIKLKLEVRPPGREPYQAELQTLIGRLDIPQYQPGTVLPVKYDPANPSIVAISGGGEEAALSPAAIGNFSPVAPGGLNPNAEAEARQAEQARSMEEFLKEADAKSEEILKMGQPAPAVIIQASSLNVFVNGNNPAMSFIVEVKPEGQDSFQAQVTGVTSEASIPKFQAGKTIYIKYDPGDHSRVAIDHS